MSSCTSEWFVPTRTFQKTHFGQDRGSTGPDDDFAARSFENVGAWILGRNMQPQSKSGMTTLPWTRRWLALLLTSAAWLSTACDSTSSSSAADAPDGATCPALATPLQTFDQMVAYLCTNPGKVVYWGVYSGTVACDGLLAVVDTHGADAQDLYLFDATTGELVESLTGHNGGLTCLGSATGIDRRTDPAFNACTVYFVDPAGGGGGGLGLQQACLDAGPGDAASEAGLTDAPHD